MECDPVGAELRQVAVRPGESSAAMGVLEAHFDSFLGSIGGPDLERVPRAVVARKISISSATSNWSRRVSVTADIRAPAKQAARGGRAGPGACEGRFISSHHASPDALARRKARENRGLIPD
jgi:hypothetical protein